MKYTKPQNQIYFFLTLGRWESNSFTNASQIYKVTSAFPAFSAYYGKKKVLKLYDLNAACLDESQWGTGTLQPGTRPARPWRPERGHQLTASQERKPPRPNLRTPRFQILEVEINEVVFH